MTISSNRAKTLRDVNRISRRYGIRQDSALQFSKEDGGELEAKIHELGHLFWFEDYHNFEDERLAKGSGETKDLLTFSINMLSEKDSTQCELTAIYCTCMANRAYGLGFDEKKLIWLVNTDSSERSVSAWTVTRWLRSQAPAAAKKAWVALRSHLET